MIHTYRKVEYISPSREVKTQKLFYGQRWEKVKGWITNVTEEVASRCGEFPKDFKVYDIEDQKNDINLESRVVALEEKVEILMRSRGGRPKKSEEE